MTTLEILQKQKETPFVHIMAYESVHSMMNDEEPIHIDSMPETQWIELGQTPKEYALSVGGTKVHAPFVERDTPAGPFAIILEGGCWRLTLGERMLGPTYDCKVKAEIAVHTALEPALAAINATPGVELCTEGITCVAQVYENEFMTMNDIEESLHVLCSQGLQAA